MGSGFMMNHLGENDEALQNAGADTGDQQPSGAVWNDAGYKVYVNQILEDQAKQYEAAFGIKRQYGAYVARQIPLEVTPSQPDPAVEQERMWKLLKDIAR